MEQLKDTAKKAVKRLTSGPSESTESGPRATALASETQQRASSVWTSMRMIFGARFQQTYGDEPNQAWLAAIGSLTDEQCAAGCAKLAKGPTDWPPALPAFYAACKPRDPGVRYLGTPTSTAELDEHLALDKPRNPQARDQALANCRRTLRMREGQP
jgi:hypothetical protein